MNYYASGKYLVVAESFKAAIGLYRQVIGDDLEELVATAGFGESMDVPSFIVADHVAKLNELTEYLEDYSVGGYLADLKALADEVTALLADEPTEPGVYEKVADKWQRVEQPVDSPVDSNGWIKWNGGECPVVNGPLVEVRLRDGMIYRSRSAADWCWGSQRYAGDEIAAYRVVS